MCQQGALWIGSGSWSGRKMRELQNTEMHQRRELSYMQVELHVCRLSCSLPVWDRNLFFHKPFIQHNTKALIHSQSFRSLLRPLFRKVLNKEWRKCWACSSTYSKARPVLYSFVKMAEQRHPTKDMSFQKSNFFFFFGCKMPVRTKRNNPVGVAELH